jgi:hypothetical protein
MEGEGMNRDIKQDTQIDPLQLDVECLRQADLFIEWAEKAVEAKIMMEKTEAALQLQARKYPDKFGLEKVTDASVNAVVKTNAKCIRTRRESMLLDRAVKALEIKKRMLENLVTLNGQQYFASPSSPRDLGEVWLRKREEEEEKLTKRMKIRKRKGKR